MISLFIVIALVFWIWYRSKSHRSGHELKYDDVTGWGGMIGCLLIAGCLVLEIRSADEWEQKYEIQVSDMRIVHNINSDFYGLDYVDGTAIQFVDNTGAVNFAPIDKSWIYGGKEKNRLIYTVSYSKSKGWFGFPINDKHLDSCIFETVAASVRLLQ